jgi:hypothetical protein
MIRRRWRLFAIAAAVAIAAVAVPVWALPNVAGPAFVRVRAVVTPRLSPSGPIVAVGAAPAVRAGSVGISVELDNWYPLSVVLGADPHPFQTAVYRHDATGHLVRVWQLGTGDPNIEEGSDSPVGGGPAGGAAVVPSGISRHAITDGSSELSLAGLAGPGSGIGVYYVRVWAYGIGSPLLPMALDGAVDPLGPPSDLPSPAAT